MNEFESISGVEKSKLNIVRILSFVIVARKAKKKCCECFIINKEIYS